MKKILVTLLAVIMVFAMCSCSSKADDGLEIANPVTECSYDEMFSKTGIEIKAPENAEDVAYAYIEMENADPIGQVEFTVEGKRYCYRAQPTAATSIMNSIGDDGFYMAEDILDALNEGVNVGATLSGLNYEWKASATIDIGYCEGIAAFNEGAAGFVSWLDVVPGILYSLGMDDGCSQDILMTMAEDIFVPVQGNAE